ncbi:MAG: tRNA dihydrouridine synthase DusB [Cyanobacteria bacterium NC_groundwater_1444_Ag_S-0.65um_54_12]|nr:tRNA dihydrouridine synthase DusB [Cyanobacteria bacterium NC_groundwater_1444_Ag_S-0.65um_54_12]
MLRVGSLRLASQVMLAPMCGICDLPYLRIVRRFDQQSLAFHEMFSALGLLQTKKSLPFTVPVALRPLGIQLLGHAPDPLAHAALLAAEAGADVVDLNLGCPVPKIAKNYDGSALLRDSKLLERILRALYRALAGRVPITIKMRLGWDDKQRNYLEVAKLAEACGVSMVTVHGRTRSQLYSGTADWGAIAEISAALAIPVIGNGDIRDPETAARKLRDSGCSGVMIGRAAQGNPWLLARIAHYFEKGEILPEPTDNERLTMAIEHCQMLVSEKGEQIGVAESRKHVAWYTRGLPESAEVRARVNQAKTAAELQQVLETYRERLLAAPWLRMAPSDE